MLSRLQAKLTGRVVVFSGFARCLTYASSWKSTDGKLPYSPASLLPQQVRCLTRIEPSYSGQRKLESQLKVAEHQNSVWRLALTNSDQITPFLCLTALKRVSKLINYGTPLGDTRLQKEFFQLLHETVERHSTRCDAKIFASLLNFSKRVVAKNEDTGLCPTLESYLSNQFMNNIDQADTFTVGLFTASMTHHLDGGNVLKEDSSFNEEDVLFCQLNEDQWHKVTKRILFLKNQWNLKTAIPLMHSLDTLHDKYGKVVEPEVWQVLFGPFCKIGFGSKLKTEHVHPSHFNVVVKRMQREGCAVETLNLFFTELFDGKRYDIIFNKRWRYIVENMPKDFGENIEKNVIDREVLSYLGRKKNTKDIFQIVHPIWTIGKLRLPVSSEPLSRLVSLVMDNLQDMRPDIQALVLRSLALNANQFERSHYHFLLKHISNKSKEFPTFVLCDVLRSVGMNKFHSESDSVWRIIHALLNRSRRVKLKFANIVYSMGGMGKHDTDPLDILKMCNTCLRDVDNFQGNELKLALDGLGNITMNHQIHLDYAISHEQLYRKLFVAIHKRLEKWKFNSRQCAYLLEAIAKSDKIHRFELVEEAVQRLVEQCVCRRMIDPKDCVTAIWAIAEIDAVVDDKLITKLLHRVLDNASDLSQEELGKVLKSLADISHWFEVDQYTREDLKHLIVIE